MSVPDFGSFFPLPFRGFQLDLLSRINRSKTYTLYVPCYFTSSNRSWLLKQQTPCAVELEERFQEHRQIKLIFYASSQSLFIMRDFLCLYNNLMIGFVVSFLSFDHSVMHMNLIYRLYSCLLALPFGFCDARVLCPFIIAYELWSQHVIAL